MYCSLRIYVDKITDSISAQNILSLFDLFDSVFEWSHDYISYMLFDPDNDRMLIDKNYSYDSRGKKDLSDINIPAVIVGKYGDLSAPIITASCVENAMQLYSKQRVQIQYPISSEPYIIRVDYSQKGTKMLTLESYNYIIQSLCACGFSVNNGIYHVYRNKNEATTLDGGQIGSFLGFNGRVNLKNYLKHRKDGCRDRTSGIYYANSVRTDSISKHTLEAIKDVVGSSNVILENNIFSFSLGDMINATPNYRIRRAIILKKLQNILC